MGSDTTVYKSEQLTGLDTVSEFLRDLADEIEEGAVALRLGDDDLVLEFPDAVEMEVEVEAEDAGPRGVKRTLEIELTWYEEDGQEDDEDAAES